MTVPGFRTPRITAQRWVASTTTPTPWGFEPLLEELGDLLGQPLLDLEAPGVHLDDARDLREPDHPAARDVGDRRGAEERQQVVLAQRVERDVLDDDHLAVADVEDRAVDQPLGVDVVAGGQLRVHPVDALRRPDQALPVGVLADLGEDLADRVLDPAVAVVGRRAVVQDPAVSPEISSTATSVSPISDSISSTRRRTCGGSSVGLGIRAMVRATGRSRIAEPLAS